MVDVNKLYMLIKLILLMYRFKKKLQNLLINFIKYKYKGLWNFAFVTLKFAIFLAQKIIASNWIYFNDKKIFKVI